MTRGKHIALCLLFIFTIAGAAKITDANAAALKAAALVSPIENTTFENTPNETTLAWKPVANADTYYVTWAYRSSAKAPWGSPTTSSAISGNENTSFVFDVPDGDGEYEWAVTAHDSTGAHSDSASFTRTFFFNSSLTLKAPKQTSPQQNAAFENVPRSTTLAWQQVAGATGYIVDVWYEVYNSAQRRYVWQEDTTDGFPITVTGQEASYYTFTLTLPSGVTAGPIQCKWRVEATSTTNASSVYSTWQTLEFRE